MMVASATPAFAKPNPSPIDEFRNHGQLVSFSARSLPPDPIHGQLVSTIAHGDVGGVPSD
jgi:hypothetical protein